MLDDVFINFTSYTAHHNVAFVTLLQIKINFKEKDLLPSFWRAILRKVHMAIGLRYV
jgi:hypothetical protein